MPNSKYITDTFALAATGRLSSRPPRARRESGVEVKAVSDVKPPSTIQEWVERLDAEQLEWVTQLVLKERGARRKTG